MDAGAWIAVGCLAAALLATVVGIPLLLRDTRRRRDQGKLLTGVGAGFDAVWRPSAEDAHADWASQIELPAPAPSPGDKGRLRDGRITIELTD